MQQAYVIGQGSGNIGLGCGAVFAKHAGLARQHIGHAHKRIALADWQLQYHRLDVKTGKAVKGHLKIGAVTVYLVDHHHDGQTGCANNIPEFFGKGAHAVHGVQHKNYAVHALEQAFHIAGKVAVAGNIQQKMTIFIPDVGGAGGLDGAAPADFFGLVVKAGGSVFYSPQAIHRPCLVQQHLGQRCFAATAGSDDGERALHFQWSRHGYLPS